MAKLILDADSRGVRSAKNDLQDLNSTGARTEAMAQRVKTALLGAGAAAAFSAAIQSTARFSQSIADLSAITGAAGKDLEFYKEQAKDIGRTTSLSASQAAQAFKLIASAKPDLLASAESLNAVTREAVALSEATGIDLPGAAQALGSALNQFQLDASKSSEVINILAASSKLGTAEVSAVTEALRNAGSAANSVGLDFAETVAGIQALAKAGRQGADAGTALRQVLLRLENTGDSKLQPSVVGLVNALDELKERNLTNTELIKLFGQEAFTAATSLLAQSDSAKELNATLRGTSTAYEQASTRMDTLIGDTKAFGSAIEGLALEAFGTDIEGAARSLVQLGTAGIRTITENMDTLATTATVVAGIFGAKLVGAAAASTAAFLSAQVSAIRYQATLASMAGVSKTAAAGMTALGAATAGFSKIVAFLGGPIGAVTVAITAVVGSLAYFITNSGKAAEEAQKLAEEIDGATVSFENFDKALAKENLAKIEGELSRLTKLYENVEKSGRSVGASQEEIAKRAADLEAQIRPLVEAKRKLNQQLLIGSQYDLGNLSGPEIQGRLESTVKQLRIMESALERVQDSFSKGGATKDDVDKLTAYVKQLEDYKGYLEGALPAQKESAATAGEGAKSYAKLAQSVRDEIYALENGQEAYEIMNTLRKENVKAGTEEAAVITSLIEKRNALREAEAQKEQQSREEGVISQARRETEALQREYDTRSEISRIYFEAEIAGRAGFFEQERALIEAQRQEELARLEQRKAATTAEYEAERERLLSNETLTAETKLELTKQLQEQEKLQLQMHEQDKTEIEAKAKDARERLAKAEMRAKIELTKSVFGALSSLMNSGSKKAFEIGKKAALANAAISGGQAAVDAWKAGMATGGPWAPLVAAAYTAASLAKTGSQINQIRSMQYGGGAASSASSGGGGAGVSPGAVGGSGSAASQATPAEPQNNTPRQPPAPVINFQINGSADAVIDEIRMAVNEGDLELISPDSRNGRDLAEAAGGN